MVYTLKSKNETARTIEIIQGEDVNDKNMPTFTMGFSEEQWNQNTEEELIAEMVKAWESSLQSDELQ